MKNLFGGLLLAAGTAALAVGVLAGVEVLLQNSSRPSRRTRRLQVDVKPAESEPFTAAEAVEEAASTPTGALVPKKDAVRNFSIKRTKSEVGYVYWILEGYGKYKCFILCDSWDEAVAQAKAKMAEMDGVEAPLTLAAHA